MPVLRVGLQILIMMYEDDFSSLEHLDAEDEEELGMPRSSIEPTLGHPTMGIFPKIFMVSGGNLSVSR